MPIYDSVEQAVQMIRDPEVLARVASVILQREYFNELVMSGTTGDCGRDARAQKGLWGDEYVVVQYSLADRWTRKVDRELRRYDTDPSLPKLIVYVTHRTTSYDAVRREQEQAFREHGVTLRIYDRGWLTLRLEREYRDVAEEHLGVRPRLPDRFADVPTRRAELQRRVVGFAAPLVESDALRTLAAWMQAADGLRVAVLVGPGGAGKTRASLESVPAGVSSVVLQAAQRLDRDAVGALAPSVPGVLVVDDAHRIPDLSGLRLLLDDGSWRGWRTILTLRPGYVDAVLEGAGLEPDETTMIEFAGLTRPESAQLLAGEPYRIAAPDVANHLMRLATGNPLLLHLAGQAAAEGRLSSQGQAELLRSYAHRLMRTLPSGLHEDLVVICALLGKLALPDQLPIIRHLHPTAALPDVRSALADVADAGLGVLSDDVFTIQPDAIAPVIVLHGLLRTAAASRLRLSDIPLPEDPDARSAILPTFAAAVVYGDGWGADALRRFAVRLPGAELSWTSVLAILREVRVYARALPTEANRVLETVIRLHREALLAHPSLLDAAADAAAELAQVDLRLALPTLLSLVALELAAGRPAARAPEQHWPS
ncbi:MAG TPA: hypothetical protein VMA77_04090 [Solirubrobacteraceae bacterium]|nr:hypothetical protein [Solirubrobacteraceae bacterium]